MFYFQSLDFQQPWFEIFYIFWSFFLLVFLHSFLLFLAPVVSTVYVTLCSQQEIIDSRMQGNDPAFK